jgi:hypothetical protein
MLAEPSAVASTLGVAGDAVVIRDVVGAQVMAWAARVVVKLMLADVADAYVASAVMEAVIVHVPAETNATSPPDELTVQTASVELV